MKIEIDLSQYMDSEKIEEFSLSHVINLIKQYPNDLFTWGDVGSISFHPHMLMPIKKDREKCEILIRPIFEYFLDCSEADEDGEIQNLKDWGSFFKGLSDDFNAKAVDFRPIQTKADVEREQLLEIIEECYDSGCSIIAKEIQATGFTIPKKISKMSIYLAIASFSMAEENCELLHTKICDLLGDLVEGGAE
jgi:hypothetical protein